MNTAVINIKVRPEVKRNARKLADDLGMSLSGLVNVLLKQVIRTKIITLSTSEEKPSEYLIRALRESEEDIKAGRVVSFKSGEHALRYLHKIASDEQKSKKN